ncbi:MAG: glycosyltransferase [Rhodanobacteraceae bacterium]|nr:glycosyltransferase [Rhodanobacteraceae bacterium]
MSPSRQAAAVLLIPCLLTGGTEVATLETARALRVLGYAVDVVVYFADEVDSMMRAEFEAAGARVIVLDIQRSAGSFRLGWALARGLRGRRYALAWLQYMTPSLLPLLIARLHSKRLFATVHVTAGHFSESARLRLRLLARSVCSRFICVSHTAAHEFFGMHASLPRHVAVLPNTVEVTSAAAAVPVDWRRRCDWPADSVVVGYVGRLALIKGPDVLIDAFAQVHARCRSARLVVVGGGDLAVELRGRVSELGLEPCVHFAGWLARDAVFPALRGFDLAVVPSREEGFGLRALDAMACGVAVVASAVGALPAVGGGGGRLVGSAAPEALADAAIALLQDEATRGAWVKQDGALRPDPTTSAIGSIASPRS